MLGDVTDDLGKFEDRVAARGRIARAGLLGQVAVAVLADRGHMEHKLVDRLDSQQVAALSLMSRLATRRSPGTRLRRLGRRVRRIRRGRPVAIARVATELCLQFSEPHLQPADVRLELRDDGFQGGAPRAAGETRGEA
jgi:hypothetical protein